MSLDITKSVVTKYLDSKHTDMNLLASDVVFRNMATGDESHGPQEVSDMLNYFYHVAFKADAETKNLVFSDNTAVFEADFVGKHIAEFAGVKATGKEVRVPLCVAYDVENEKIKRARIYFELPALFEQLK